MNHFFTDGFKEIPRSEMKTYLPFQLIWHLAYLIKGDIFKDHDTKLTKRMPNWVPRF